MIDKIYYIFLKKSIEAYFVQLEYLFKVLRSADNEMRI